MFVNGPVMCGELKPDRSRIVFDAFLRNLLDHAQLTKDEFEIRLLVCRTTDWDK